ncbi:MAG: hypothetical protein MZV49_24110 [Rhodopseudomonas palustris]|nr:hypothetical protein [Rhodopseudomonas palustris]
MAKFEKTLASLQELKASQEGYLQKAEDKGNSDRIEVHTTRIKALATAIKHLTKKREELLAKS